MKRWSIYNSNWIGSEQYEAKGAGRLGEGGEVTGFEGEKEVLV